MRQGEIKAMKSNSIDIETKNLEVELAGKNGIRLMWNGPRQCTVEVKDGDVWRELKCVQNIKILVGIDHILPKVHIDYVVLP